MCKSYLKGVEIFLGMGMDMENLLWWFGFFVLVMEKIFLTLKFFLLVMEFFFFLVGNGGILFRHGFFWWSWDFFCWNE